MCTCVFCGGKLDAFLKSEYNLIVCSDGIPYCSEPLKVSLVDPYDKSCGLTEDVGTLDTLYFKKTFHGEPVAQPKDGDGYSEPEDPYPDEYEEGVEGYIKKGGAGTFVKVEAPSGVSTSRINTTIDMEISWMKDGRWSPGTKASGPPTGRAGWYEFASSWKEVTKIQFPMSVTCTGEGVPMIKWNKSTSVTQGDEALLRRFHDNFKGPDRRKLRERTSYNSSAGRTWTREVTMSDQPENQYAGKHRKQATVFALVAEKQARSGSINASLKMEIPCTPVSFEIDSQGKIDVQAGPVGLNGNVGKKQLPFPPSANFVNLAEVQSSYLVKCERSEGNKWDPVLVSIASYAKLRGRFYSALVTFGKKHKQIFKHSKTYSIISRSRKI